MMEGGGGNGRMGGGWEGECCCFGDHLSTAGKLRG